MQSKIEESDSLLSSLKKSLAEKEEKFAAETLKLKRALEEEEFNKVTNDEEAKSCNWIDLLCCAGESAEEADCPGGRAFSKANRGIL